MNINRLMSNKSRASNSSSLSELFISFIAKVVIGLGLYRLLCLSYDVEPIDCVDIFFL